MDEAWILWLSSQFKLGLTFQNLQIIDDKTQFWRFIKLGFIIVNLGLTFQNLQINDDKTQFYETPKLTQQI